MFLTKKHLPRRTFLRGLGASVALPLLDAMIPAGTALAQTAAAPRPRIGFIYFPHGAVYDQWLPAKTGRDFDLPPILAPFKDYKQHMTVVSGLRNRGPEGSGVHTMSPGTWLSCTSPMTPGLDLSVAGKTADQIVAEKIGQDTPFPSLEMCHESLETGTCSKEFGCGLRETLSFQSFERPLPMERNPRKMFFRLFGQGDTAAEREAIMSQAGSLLDLVTDSSASVRASLDAADRVQLDEYLTSVREIERRVQIASDQDFSGFDLPDAPTGVPQSWDDHIKLMFDLVALAFQADLTRVVTFMMAAETSMLTYNQVGVSEAFHPLSHHSNNASKLARLAVLQAYNSTLFTHLLDRFKNAKDGDGSLLDHSILLYGSNMSNSNLHNADPLPSVVFGHGHGRIKGGQHLAYKQDTPHANLIQTLVDRVGVSRDSFADSTGEISEI